MGCGFEVRLVSGRRAAGRDLQESGSRLLFGTPVLGIPIFATWVSSQDARFLGSLGTPDIVETFSG